MLLLFQYNPDIKSKVLIIVCTVFLPDRYLVYFQSNIENTNEGVYTGLTITLGDNAKRVESITFNLEKAGSSPGLLKGTQIVVCESEQPPGN